MERVTVVLLTLLVMLVATFLPVNIQDAEAARAKAKKQCKEPELPEAVVGNYNCEIGKRKVTCRLDCPKDMQRSRNKKLVYRCQRGKWSTPPNLHSLHCIWSKPQTVGLVKQNMAPPKILNDLINLKLDHCQRYLSMAFFFDRGDVQLPGFHKYFMATWKGCQETATKLMKYVNKRGGFLDLKDMLRSPTVDILIREGQRVNVTTGLPDGTVGLVAMETALAMEREFHQHVLDAADKVASFNNQDKMDPHFVHELEHHYMRPNVKLIKQLRDFVTRLRAFKRDQDNGTGEYVLGEYELDSNLQ